MITGERRRALGALAFALVAAAGTPATATTTTRAAIPATAWTDLGQGPLQIQVAAGSACLVEADVAPTDVSPATCGFVLSASPLAPPPSLFAPPGAAHVFARGLAAPATLAYAPTAASGSGSGAPFASGTGGFAGVLLGTAATTIVPAASGTRRALSIRNVAPTTSPGASITICSSVPPSGSSAALVPSPNAAGCTTLYPGGVMSYPAQGYVPQEAFSAAAAMANTPVTVELH